MRQIKIVIEKHTDGYVAYPLGMKGIVVREGDTYEEALADVKSAIHIENSLCSGRYLTRSVLRSLQPDIALR